jgi:succinyl-diaminopimelate desuccinylase
MINFKEEVIKRKDQLIEDLRTLVKHKSELTTFDPSRKMAPFGEDIQKAFEWMLNLGEKDGFSVRNLDGYAGHIEYGTQEKYIATIGHLDVVPAGDGWDFDPYAATIKDGKIYGRGATDDKGPTMAAYYAMKIIKELQLPMKHRIKLIIGNDEETSWRCMHHYFKELPELPVVGFVPDADFPLIYGEKGISRIIIEGELGISDITSFEGGLRDNMVPDTASVTLKLSKPYDVLFKQFLDAHQLKGSIEAKNSEVTLLIKGKSAHGSTPDVGRNAIDLMMQFLAEEEQSEFALMYQNKLLHDTKAKKLGLDHIDPEMGPVTNNVGILKIKDEHYQINLNYRYPHGVSFDDVIASIKTQFPISNVTVSHHQKLLYQDPNSAFIRTLHDVYQKYTNDTQTKPYTIGGGTFARAIPNAVAFGAQFPGKSYQIHEPNEFIEIEELLTTTAIYAEALYRLGNA